MFVRWRQDVSNELVQLRTAVDQLLQRSQLPPLAQHAQGMVAQEPQQEDASGEEIETLLGGDEMQPPAPAFSSRTPLDDSLHGRAIDSMYEVTGFPSLRSNGSPKARRPRQAQDLISRHVLLEDDAQQLFDRFVSRLDHYCYGIMCPHSTLASLRASSSLLLSAVCAVSALHAPSGTELFKSCHAEFLALVSSSMFSTSYSTDDVRALIVGAYWLTPISYTLIGHAIRIATRLNYHLAFFSVIRGSQQSVDQARLWYVLYVLDHHSSILYGRPAIISAATEPGQKWETFISSNNHSPIDKRITSQVALHQITARVKDVFDVYQDKPVPDHSLGQLRTYIVELDRWYLVWGDRMGMFLRKACLLTSN